MFLLSTPLGAADKGVAKASPPKPPVTQPAGKAPVAVPDKQEPVKAKGLKPLTGVL